MIEPETGLLSERILEGHSNGSPGCDGSRGQISTRSSQLLFLYLQLEKIWTVPNALSASRILLAPTLPIAILSGHTGVAVGTLAYCAITDAVLIML